MAWYDKLIGKKKQEYSKKYSDLYLQRLGRVQNFSDRGDTYIESGYQDNPVVFSMTNIISKNGSTAKWVCKSRETGEEVENIPLKLLMANPLPDQTWEDFIQAMLTQKVLTGNAFAAVARYSNSGMGELAGKPKNLFIMPSSEIQIYLGDKGNSIDQYVLDFHGNVVSPESGVSAKDVLHIKSPNPDYSIEGDFLWGQSPFRAARRSIQTFNESLETGVWLLQNRGPEGLLVNDDPELELGPEAAADLKSKIRAQAQGPKNAGNIPIVDANLKWLQISANAEDVLLLPQRIQAAKEICNVLNFPIQLIGIESNTYQNAKEAKKALWENVIIPELEEIKNGLNRFLTPEFGNDIYLDYDLHHIAALQEDKPITELANIATINEVRAMRGLAPMKDGRGEELYVGFVQGTLADMKDKPKDKPTEDE